MMPPEPQRQHQWLTRLVGKWTFETECKMGADQPPMKFGGSEVVRSLGGLWMLAEGETEMPGGGTGQTIMTLGYDPQSERFVGTFIGSMMTHLWPYNGTLDAHEKVLTLDSEGPNFTGTGMASYQDIITLLSDDHRTLSSQYRTEDGQWHHFMMGHYRRQK
jgi:hypothetical protein